MTSNEGLGQGSCGDKRSRYFYNLWKNPLAQATGSKSKDPFGSLAKWMRTSALNGCRKELPTRRVFPQTWEDTAAVEKSKMRDSETLDAPYADRPLFEARKHATAYHSLAVPMRESGLVAVFNKQGCVLKAKVYSEATA